MLAVVAAGCGGFSDNDAKGNDNASCPAVDGVTANQVKLGLLYPDTGTSASLFLSYRAGIDARLGVANAQGGVDGRTIDYDWADDRSSLASNLTSAQHLVDDEHDFAILESTTVATGSAAWLHRQGIPVVGTSVENVWTQFNNMFSYVNWITAGPAAASLGQYVKEHGGTKVAILYSGFNDTSRRYRDEFVKSLRAAHVRVVDQIDAEPTAYDANAIARELKNVGADALVGGADPNMFVTVAATAQLSGVGLKTILASTGYDPEVLAKAGIYLKGTFSVFLPYAPFEKNLPAHREFLDGMARYAPQLQPPQAELALEGWLTTDLMLTGLKAAGRCLTRQSFITATRALKGYTAGGLIPKPVNLKANFGQPNPCYSFVKVNSAGTGWDIASSIPRCNGLVGS